MKPVILALAAAIPATARAATVVDWLELAGGASATSFVLAADGGLPTAFGALAIESGKGASFPNFPQSRVLNAGSWSGETGYIDSLTGNDRVSGFDLRVVSRNGPASYTLTLEVPAGRELVVAIGGLYRSGAVGTGSLSVSASGGGVFAFDRSLSWTGSDLFDQEIEWVSATGTLVATSGSAGDSDVAFLRIGPLSGANPKFTFQVPDGYGGPGTTGDSITFAIGAVVPEPGAPVLAALATFLALTRRRRREEEGKAPLLR